MAYSCILVSIYQCTYLSGLRIMSEIFFSGLRVAATWLLLLLLLLAVDLLVDALCWLLPEVGMLVVDSRCFAYEGSGIVLPICTFTLRPMSGPFALITLVLEKRKDCYWDECKLIYINIHYFEIFWYTNCLNLNNTKKNRDRMNKI